MGRRLSRRQRPRATNAIAARLSTRQAVISRVKNESTQALVHGFHLADWWMGGLILLSEINGIHGIGIIRVDL